MCVLRGLEGASLPTSAVAPLSSTRIHLGDLWQFPNLRLKGSLTVYLCLLLSLGTLGFCCFVLLRFICMCINVLLACMSAH